MKRAFSTTLLFLFIFYPFSVFANNTTIQMYSRVDGSPITVETGSEAKFASDYAIADEIVTVYSRTDGSSATIKAVEIAQKQDTYKTHLQTMDMFSKYDGAKITVWAYEAAAYSAEYFGDKTLLDLYSRYDGFHIVVWASDYAACFQGYYKEGDIATMYSRYDRAAISVLAEDIWLYSGSYSLTWPRLLDSYPENCSVPSFTSLTGIVPYTKVQQNGFTGYVYSDLYISDYDLTAYTDYLLAWGFEQYYYDSVNEVTVYKRENVRASISYSYYHSALIITFGYV